MLKWLIVAASLVVATPVRAQSDDCPANAQRYQDAVSKLESLLSAWPIGSRQSMPVEECSRLRAALLPAVEAIKQTRSCGYDDMQLRVAEFKMMDHGCSPAFQ